VNGRNTTSDRNTAIATDRSSINVITRSAPISLCTRVDIVQPPLILLSGQVDIPVAYQSTGAKSVLEQ